MGRCLTHILPEPWPDAGALYLRAARHARPATRSERQLVLEASSRRVSVALPVLALPDLERGRTAPRYRASEKTPLVHVWCAVGACRHGCQRPAVCESTRDPATPLSESEHLCDGMTGWRGRGNEGKQSACIAAQRCVEPLTDCSVTSRDMFSPPNFFEHVSRRRNKMHKSVALINVMAGAQPSRRQNGRAWTQWRLQTLDRVSSRP